MLRQGLLLPSVPPYPCWWSYLECRMTTETFDYTKAIGSSRRSDTPVPAWGLAACALGPWCSSFSIQCLRTASNAASMAAFALPVQATGEDRFEPVCPQSPP